MKKSQKKEKNQFFTMMKYRGNSRLITRNQIFSKIVEIQDTKHKLWLDQTKTQKERNQEEYKHDNHLDIWEDLLSMKLFIGKLLQLTEHYPTNVKRAKKKVMRYITSKKMYLYFQNLVVLRPKDRYPIIRKIHNEIGHFGEACTFLKIKHYFFWHDKTNSIKEFVKAL